MPRVILHLTCDMGDYTDMLEDRDEIPTNPEDWAESFYQSNLTIGDLTIKSVELDGD